MASSTTPLRWQRSLAVLVTVFLVVLVIACLHFAKAVLVPVAFSILLTFLLTPLVSALQRRKVPRVPAVILVVLAAGVLLLGLGAVLATQITSLANDLPAKRDLISNKLAELHAFTRGGAIDKVSEAIDHVTEDLKNQNLRAPKANTPEPITPIPVVVKDENITELDQFGRAAGPLLEPLAEAGLVVILVIFMLISREDLRNRLIRLVGPNNITVTTKALDDAGQRISRYLLMQLIINASFGLGIGIGLFFIGVPYAMLWGFLAAVLRYIPYIGPWLAAILPLAMSVITFTSWFPILSVIVLFLVLELISNLIMEPMLYGQSIGVSEAALLVAVAFWTWVWGMEGLVLATPLTVCLVVLGKYVPHLEFFDVILGDKPALDTDIRFYQRLLARDEDEAEDVAEEQLAGSSLTSAFDDLLIPAMTYAKRDLAHEQLSEEDYTFVLQESREIGEGLALEVQKKSLASAGESSKSGSWADIAPPVPVLFCPARDEADGVALGMFRHLLPQDQCEVELLTSHMLASELVSRVEEKPPALLCIAALPPGGLAHTRFVCMRLRSRLPNLKIVVGRWGLKGNMEKNRTQLVEAGADFVGTTLEETRGQVLELVGVARAAGAAERKASSVGKRQEASGPVRVS